MDIPPRKGMEPAGSVGADSLTSLHDRNWLLALLPETGRSFDGTQHRRPNQSAGSLYISHFARAMGALLRLDGGLGLRGLSTLRCLFLHGYSTNDVAPPMESPELV